MLRTLINTSGLSVISRQHSVAGWWHRSKPVQPDLDIEALVVRGPTWRRRCISDASPVHQRANTTLFPPSRTGTFERQEKGVLLTNFRSSHANSKSEIGATESTSEHRSLRLPSSEATRRHNVRRQSLTAQRDRRSLRTYPEIDTTCDLLSLNEHHGSDG